MAIMLMSVVGYGFVGTEKTSPSKKITYNGFEFINQNGVWITQIGETQFAFKYNPKEVEKITSELKSLENYYQKPLYLSSENGEAEAEIYQNLDKFVQRTQRACLEGGKCLDKNLPIKTCEDNFIIIEEGENYNIRQENNCVFIESTRENLTKLSDEFLFKITGIED